MLNYHEFGYYCKPKAGYALFLLEKNRTTTTKKEVTDSSLP